MCGICGVVLADPRGVVSKRQIETMCDVIAHRGPDAEGVHVVGRVGLGHRRLSIIDLAHGQQPMTNEDESVWLIFNGEIYNYLDYQASLRARGHAVRTRSDTEVLVHLYEDHRTSHLAELRGMFAFAIWDERRHSLTLARDHTGIKPLYYASTPEGDLVFGSEIKAIFASGMIAPELDSDVVAEYFAFGHVAGERTLYRGVRKLEAGHVLTWRDGQLHRHCFWRAGHHASEEQHEPVRNSREAGAAFWPRFVDSVRSQLVADVPLGVFLSGGLDSSLIVAAMRAAGVSRLQSFSVGFAEASANELPFARVAARAFATDHREVVVGADEFFAALPKLSWHRDAPLTFSASIPLYFVSRLAHDHVKVVLTGEGSDELFAGYGRYPRALWNRSIAAALDRVLSSGTRARLAASARAFGDGYLGSRLQRSFVARHGTLEDSYLEAFADFDARHRASLLGRLDGVEAFGDLGRLIDRELLARNPLEAMLRLDQATYLEELLMKQDQMSMAASIESRVPFLDHRLVAWSATLPSSAKLSRFTGKALVREAGLRHLPREIARGEKRGFPVPMAAWLRGPGLAWLHRYSPARTDELLDARYVSRLLAEHVAGRDHTARLWRVLAFQVWRHEVLAPARTELARSARPRPALA